MSVSSYMLTVVKEEVLRGPIFGDIRHTTQEQGKEAMADQEQLK
jgi:hypothetical protein